MAAPGTRLVVLYALLSLSSVSSAHAGARAVIGDSWSTPRGKLQSIVDATYGPGRINVATDYLGARPGDPDPIVWMNRTWPILQVREIAGTEHRANLGWYVEPDGDGPPSIDAVDDGLVFRAGDAGPATTHIYFGNRDRRIGFYLDTPDAGSGQGSRTFYTNRRFNDVGPGGAGALHEPTEGGDIQALIFDVSSWKRPYAWLVCFENRDSGAQPGPCCETTDNDYADYVFEVRAEATTATLAPSFGLLKRLYRD